MDEQRTIFTIGEITIFAFACVGVVVTILAAVQFLMAHIRFV
jgi:hypothetical protein